MENRNFIICLLIQTRQMPVSRERVKGRGWGVMGLVVWWAGGS